MERLIYNLIKKENNSDGVYVEKYLKTPIKLNNSEDEEIVRLIITERGYVVAHLLNENDDTHFVNFASLEEKYQKAIFDDVFVGSVNLTLDEFFDYIKSYLDNGDKLVVSYEQTEDGEDDYDYLVYSFYNSTDTLLGEYHAKYEKYIKY